MSGIEEAEAEMPALDALMTEDIVPAAETGVAETGTSQAQSASAQNVQVRDEVRTLRAELAEMRKEMETMRGQQDRRAGTSVRQKKTNEGFKRARPGERPPAAGPAQKGGKTPAEKAMLEKEFSALAKRYQRCYGCGRFVPPQMRASHKPVCVKNKQAYWSAMGKVKAIDGRGQDPNRFVDADGNAPVPSNA